MYKKRLLYAVVCVVIVAALIVFVICHNKQDEHGESVLSTESTESVYSGEVMSSFGDEDETEVVSDDRPVYNITDSGKVVYDDSWTDEDRKKYEEQAKAYIAEQSSDVDYLDNPILYPGKYTTFERVDVPEEDPTSSLVHLISAEWKYIKIGDVITVDGIKCDMIPTGWYLCDDRVSGGSTDSDFIDFSTPRSGVFMGGKNLEAGTYKVLSGKVTSTFAATGLVTYKDKVVQTFAETYVGGFKIDEDTGTIYICDGALYEFSNAAIERVGD